MGKVGLIKSDEQKSEAKKIKKDLSPQKGPTCQPKIYHVIVFLAPLVICMHLPAYVHKAEPKMWLKIKKKNGGSFVF